MPHYSTPWSGMMAPTNVRLREGQTPVASTSVAPKVDLASLKENLEEGAAPSKSNHSLLSFENVVKDLSIATNSDHYTKLQELWGKLEGAYSQAVTRNPSSHLEGYTMPIKLGHQRFSCAAKPIFVKGKGAGHYELEQGSLRVPSKEIERIKVYVGLAPRKASEQTSPSQPPEGFFSLEDITQLLQQQNTIITPSALTPLIGRVHLMLSMNDIKGEGVVPIRFHGADHDVEVTYCRIRKARGYTPYFYLGQSEAEQSENLKRIMEMVDLQANIFRANSFTIDNQRFEPLAPTSAAPQASAGKSR
jgi:hypothetical protein